MQNYKIYAIAIFLLSFNACSPSHDEAKIQSSNQNTTKRPCTKEYIPVCGEVEVECITTPCEPIKKTFPNACVLANNKRAKLLYKGTCK